jgi:hypothetical protein
MLHSGPGSAAAGTVADTWSSMSGALSDIQQDINAGVTASGATWVGDAADSARGALGPLGEWAAQASTAADVMRASVELQGDLLAKARADMPAPIDVPQQSPIGQLITAQMDYEVTELASHAAAQRAFQVMAQYEAATDDNTNTLGDFGEPPKLVVDTAPITGVAVRRSSGFDFHGRSSAFEGRPAGETPPVRSTPRRGSGSTATRAVAPKATEAGPEDHVITAAPDEEAAHVSVPPSVVTSPSGMSGSSSASSGVSATPSGVSATSPSPAGEYRAVPADRPVVSAPVIGESTSPSSAGATAPSAAMSDRDRRSSGAVFAPTPDRHSAFPGAVVPVARRPDGEREPDDQLHESKYLLEADDIYGAGQTYSPPVIGESRQRR